jgi:hypothetical protein
VSGATETYQLKITKRMLQEYGTNKIYDVKTLLSKRKEEEDKSFCTFY